MNISAFITLCHTILFLIVSSSHLVAAESSQREPLVLYLPVDDVIVTLLKNQWDVQISMEGIDRQQGVVRESAGPFDPIIDATLIGEKLTHVQIDGLKTMYDGWVSGMNVSARKMARIGTIATVGASVDEVYNPLFLITNTIPTRRTNNFSLFFNVDQPLLRRFIDNPEAINEQVTQIGLDISIQEFIKTVAQQVRDAVTIYWDLAAAQQSQLISIRSQERISELVKAADKLIAAGELAAAENLQQYAEIARERAQELATQRAINTSFQQLLLSMGIQGYPSRSAPPMSLNAFPELEDKAYLKPLPALIDTAWTLRPEVNSAQLQIDQTDLLLRGATNETLPELNVRMGVNYLNNEIGRRGRPFFSSVNERKPEVDWSISLQFSTPIYNDHARGLQKERYYERFQALTAQEKVFGDIRNHLTAAYQNHLEIMEEYQSAKESVNWYQKTLEAELKRLKEGYSTIFIVIDFQRRLDDALRRLVDVERAYAENVVELLYETGQLVSYDPCSRRISISDVLRLGSLEFVHTAIKEGDKTHGIE